MIGSPPLTRVLQREEVIYMNYDRITPAHAGITVFATVLFIFSRDHPRSRGYYSDDEERGILIEGSPPLTRVLLFSSDTSLEPCGITPAHAGITDISQYADPKFEDHPRSRGYY